MNKNFKGTLILAGVFAVLLGWYLIFEQRVRPEREKKAEEAKRLVQLDRESIQELELERKQDKGKQPATYEVIKVKKVGSDWHLAAPVEDEADGAAVSAMLGTLASTQEERQVDAQPKDLEPYGLKEPHIKVRVRKDSSSEWTEIHLGNDTPVGFNVYAKLAKEPAVYTASRTLKTSFDKPLADIRNKKVLKLSRADVDEVEVQNPKESFVLKKGENDSWTLARTGIPADATEWNKTFNVLLDAKAKSFPDDAGRNLAKFGLSRPLIRVTLSNSKTNKKVSVALGKQGNQYYLRHSEKPTVYEVEKELADKLNRPSDDYRNLYLVRFNRFSLSRFKLERKDGAAELTKTGTDWAVVGDKDFKVDGARVDNFLTQLQDAKAKDFLSTRAAEGEFKDADLVIHLFEKEGDKEKAKATLRLKRKGNRVLALRSDLPLPMVVQTDVFGKLNLKKGDFAKKEEQKKPEQATADGKKTG